MNVRERGKEGEGEEDKGEERENTILNNDIS